MRRGTAYRKRKKQRKIIRERVFDYIKTNGEVSTYKIRRALNLKMQTLTGRLSELEQDGLIYQRGVFFPEIGRPCTTWQETPSELVEARKTENWNKRLVLWVQKGRNNGFISEKEEKLFKKQSTFF